MPRRVFTGTALGFITVLAMATTSRASSNEPVTVDVYGSSYRVELDHEATAQRLQNQPWWGNKKLASGLCEALVHEGEEIASVGFNSVEIDDENYIEAYLVMPNTTCSGPVVIAPEDIGHMTGGTFFVLSGNVCFTSNPAALHAQIHKNHAPHRLYQQASAINCGYFNHSILY